jgi:hypothetical protein
MSGLPPLLLKTTELSAVDGQAANELAAVKLFDAIEFSTKFSKWSKSQKWAYFSSRVKLVDRNYRQSMEDLTEDLVSGP